MSVSTKSYSIVRDNNMQTPKEEEWYNPRHAYLKTITEPLINTCPECNTEKLEHDTDHAQSYCPRCGLVIREPIHYVGLEKINYPSI